MRAVTPQVHERLASYLPEDPRERLRRCIEAREKAFHVYKLALERHSTSDWQKAEDDWREAIRATEEAMSDLEAE